LGITANRERIRHLLERSIGIVTALVPYIGYDRASAVAREALETDRGVYELVLEKGWLTREELDEILSPEAMTRPRPMPVLRGRFDSQEEVAAAPHQPAQGCSHADAGGGTPAPGQARRDGAETGPCRFRHASAAADRAAGSRRVEVEPRPNSLWTVISPPSRRASCSERARPRPVPPWSRVDDPSTWRNSSKMTGRSSSAMPIPVSSTTHSTRSCSFAHRAAAAVSPACAAPTPPPGCHAARRTVSLTSP